MATVLKGQLTRELNTFPGLIVTLTENGITLRMKSKRRSTQIPWEVIFGAGAMLKGENKEVMLRGSYFVLKELGFEDEK